MIEEDRWAFRDAVVADMRACMGVPFLHQGRHPDQGLDCIGLPNYACAKNNYQHKMPLKSLRRCYREQPNPDDLREALEGECDELYTELPIDERIGLALPLDFLLVSNQPSLPPTHVMIVTESGWVPVVIHTHPKLRRVTEHSLTTEWREAVRGVFRLKVLANG